MLEDLIRLARQKGASDLHLHSGRVPMVRIDGKMKPLTNELLLPSELEGYGAELLDIKHREELEQLGETDFAFTSILKERCRVNAYHASARLTMSLRLIASTIPSCQQLGLPSALEQLLAQQQGLLLVTGPTGSGKSTTLAALINKLNQEASFHIITLEDPIEYVYPPGKSLIEQREVGRDTQSFSSGLRSCLRQDPDVILVGELRDNKTMEVALAAAETGHLVLSTLHTLGAASSVDRIIDAFADKDLIRKQLSVGLLGILSQRLLPRKDGKGRIAAFELMIATEAVKNIIREGNTHQLQSYIETGRKLGMLTMEKSLEQLHKQELI